ncbi:MAG: hypothetical protein HY898_11525 [Deltaproteobacteria bacterium]|nr:hypothetical protein [Deltaproteobacteria bacterium]
MRLLPARFWLQHPWRTLVLSAAAIAACLWGGGCKNGTFSLADGGAAVAAGANHALEVGPGFTDVSPHQLVRTKAGVLYAFAPECSSYPACPSNALRAYRGAVEAAPGTFALADAAHQPRGDIGTAAVAIDGADKVHVLFTERSDGGSAKYAVFDTASDTWGGAEVIESTGWTTFGQGDEGAAIAVDAAGTPHAAWTYSSGGALHVHWAMRTAGRWSLPSQLDDAPLAPNHNTWHPTLAFAPGGELWIAWLDGSTNYAPDGTIRTRRRAGDGTWTPSLAIAEPAMTGIDNGPSLLVTADGVAHLTFCNTKNQIRYWYEAGQGWQGDRQPAAQVTHNPSLGPDGAGGVYIYGHGAPSDGTLDGHGDNLYRLHRPAGAASWSEWTLYANGAFDSSVTTRWSQFFHYLPTTLDVGYWANDYPNVLWIGSER